MRNCASGNLEIPGSRFARPGMTVWLASVHPAEGVDQHQNGKRHAEHPQQQITSHERVSGNELNCVSMPAEKYRSGQPHYGLGN
jgi:hypothetical protein